MRLAIAAIFFIAPLAAQTPQLAQASALLRQAYDSNDPALYDKALKLLNSLPADYPASKLKTTALLGRSDLANARKLAVELNHKAPDDIEVWGLLTDVNVALGNYSEAERCAQWILDLRRGSALGFEKAASLRETFGDFEGALEYVDETLHRTALADTQQRAWLLIQRAHLALALHNAKDATGSLDEAAKLYPDSQRLLAAQAELKAAQGQFAEAAALLEKRYQTTRTAANLYDWAQALERAGMADKAAAEFALFENQAPKEVPFSTLSLIRYYSDHKANPTQALALAKKQADSRQDWQTLDALAWALYKNGQLAEAKTTIDKALAVGVQDPSIRAHAAAIGVKPGGAAE